MTPATPPAAPAAASPAPVASASFFKAILLVTAIAGTLDIVAAHLHVWAVSGRFPLTLFKGIAGGVFGRAAAAQGGAGMMAVGAFCHYFISFFFTLLFFLLRPRLAWLRRNPWAVGSAYAIGVWSIMNLVVLPLSALAARLPDFSNPHTYIGLVVLVTVFGLPIAWGAARYYGVRAPVAA